MTVARRPEHPGAPAAFTALEEAAVVALAQAGDAAAFEFLVLAYRGRIHRLALRMLGDAGEAEDVVQETLAAGWRALPLLETPGAFGGWLYRTAANKSRDVLRRRSSHPVEAVDAADLGSALIGSGQPDMDPHRTAETAAELLDLAVALRALPEDLRSCWLLRELHEQSYREIGSALHISPHAVRGRLARAREKLAEAMVAWR